MSEIKKSEGTIIDLGLGPNGKNKLGKNWQLYNYGIEVEGNRYSYSSFKDFNIRIGEKVSFEYVEKPNQIKPQYPYRNLVRVEKVSEEDLEEADTGVDLFKQVPINTSNAYIVTAEDKEFVAMIKALGVKVSEHDFFETAKNHLSKDEKRIFAVWKCYND